MINFPVFITIFLSLFKPSLSEFKLKVPPFIKISSLALSVCLLSAVVSVDTVSLFMFSCLLEYQNKVLRIVVFIYNSA